jgi:octaprenyl-diphosphate synthase
MNASGQTGTGSELTTTVNASAAAASAIASLTGCIGQELRAVDGVFAEELSSDLPCVNVLVKHVSRFRGKMLRPLLLLLSGKACGRLTDAHVTLAAVVEMVHMATLVTTTCWTRPSCGARARPINHLRGNEAAVMLGDYLISHSYHLCSSLDSQLASRLIARTTNRVCEGELLQIDNRNNLELTEETYLEIITRKTASLCATCCLLGSKFAGRVGGAGRASSSSTGCRWGSRSRSRTTSSTWSATSRRSARRWAATSRRGR